jgi:hypothetical protein
VIVLLTFRIAIDNAFRILIFVSSFTNASPRILITSPSKSFAREIA